MPGRRSAAAVTAGVAVVLIAGCAAVVTGSPRAATAPPEGPSGATSGSSSGVHAPASSITTPGTVRTTVLSSMPSSVSSSAPSSVPSSVSGTASGTAPGTSIRPMPPLDPTGSPSTTGLASTGAQGSSSAAGPATVATVAGIPIGSVLAALSSRHVAGVGSTADLDALAALAARARKDGLQLSVVSIGRSISDSDTSAVADELFGHTGGTLLVLSPSLVSARSDQLTDQQRNDAVKAAADGRDDVQAVSKFVDAALAGIAAASTSRPAPTPPTTGETGRVGGVDVGAVVTALGADHIAITEGVTQVSAKDLSTSVQRAWKGGVKLYVAVLRKDATGHLSDVARAIMGHTGGTVIVASPSMYAIASKQVSDAQLNAALDAGSRATSYAALVRAMVDSLLHR